MSRVVAKGICQAAQEKIGLLQQGYYYSVLRRVNSTRQTQIADLMAACADYSYSLLYLLIFASKRSDFVRGKRRVRGLSKAELAKIENVFPRIEDAFRRSARSYADDARALMLTEAYVRRILANPRIAAYVRSAHPSVFGDLKRLGMDLSAAEKADPNPPTAQ